MLSATFEIASVIKDQLYKVETDFIDSDGKIIQIALNCKEKSFRVRYNNFSRLFFYETGLFNSTHFKNEYGVESGKLIYSDITSGKVYIDLTNFQFKLTGDDLKMILYKSIDVKPFFIIDINDELLIQDLDDQCQKDLLHTLVFSFGCVYSFITFT